MGTVSSEIILLFGGITISNQHNVVHQEANTAAGGVIDNLLWPIRQLETEAKCGLNSTHCRPEPILTDA